MSEQPAFGKIEVRGVMKFLFLQQKNATEIHSAMKAIMGDKCPSYSTVQHWVRRFRTGHFDVEDEPRSGRPVEATTEGKAEVVHDLVLADRRISAKRVAEIVGISDERVRHILHNILDMRKLSAKWVPKCLQADQKRKRVETARDIINRFDGRENFVTRLITMDETWLYHYDPETKEQSKQWRHHGSPRPQKYRVQKSAGKVLASVFWDKDGVLLVRYLRRGQTVNAAYYTSLLDELRAAVKAKRRGKLSQGVLFLQDNAPAHTARVTLQKIHDLGFQLVDHPPYSPDLAPSDYHLFPHLKRHLKGRQFGSDEEVIDAAETWFADQPKDFFSQGLMKLRDRCVKSIEKGGDYVE